MIPAGTRWADLDDEEVYEAVMDPVATKTPWIVFKDSINFRHPRFVDIRCSINGVVDLVTENQWGRWFAWAPLTGQVFYLQSETLHHDSLANGGKRFNQLKACVPPSEWKKYIEGETPKRSTPRKKETAVVAHSSNPFDALTDL
jgi:hypothetical protein